MGLGQSVATRRLAAQHDVFAHRVFAAAAADRSRLEIRVKVQDRFLYLLDSGLHRFTLVEFQNRALERKRCFYRLCRRSLVLEGLRDRSSISGSVVLFLFTTHCARNPFSARLHIQ